MGAGERRLADAHHWHAVEVAQAALDDADAEHIGHEVDRRGRALKTLQQRDDAGLGTQRQGDEDFLDAVLAYERGCIVQVAQLPAGTAGFGAGIAAVIEIAGEIQPHPWPCQHAVGHSDTQCAGADHHRAAAVAAAFAGTVHDDMAQAHCQQLQHRRDEHPEGHHLTIEQAEASGAVAKAREDRQQREPGPKDAHRGRAEPVVEAVDPRPSQCDDQEAKRQVGATDRLVLPMHRDHVHQHGDGWLEQGGDQRRDRWRRAAEIAFASGLEHQGGWIKLGPLCASWFMKILTVSRLNRSVFDQLPVPRAQSKFILGQFAASSWQRRVLAC